MLDATIGDEKMPEVPMYDSLAEDYDRFTHWTNRLNFEIPLLERLIKGEGKAGAPRILDAACGTGMHVIALAQLGYDCAGADLSPRMIERAKSNAATAGMNIEFRVAGFGQLQKTFPDQLFDVLLCLGNSLPHVLTLQELDETVTDFARCLRPGGLLILQSRNFDSVMSSLNRWMPAEAFSDAEHEWLFQRFYDFEADGLIRFNMITLKRRRGADWQAKVTSTMLYPQTEQVVLAALTRSGFTSITSLGGMSGEAFDPQSSPNLVVTARRGS
jgi:ubiquinone/menaquinone biosynthesis C-methylase UbiE